MNATSEKIAEKENFFDFVTACARDRSMSDKAFQAINKGDVPGLIKFFEYEGYELKESEAAKLIAKRDLFEKSTGVVRPEMGGGY